MPRITPNGFESSETWAVDLTDRMPIVDDRPPPVETGKKLNAEASERELKGFREYLHGKDK
jgi:hypothetical protein